MNWHFIFDAIGVLAEFSFFVAWRWEKRRSNGLRMQVDAWQDFNCQWQKTGEDLLGLVASWRRVAWFGGFCLASVLAALLWRRWRERRAKR